MAAETIRPSSGADLPANGPTLPYATLDGLELGNVTLHAYDLLRCDDMHIVFRGYSLSIKSADYSEFCLTWSLMMWPTELTSRPEPPATDADISEFVKSVFATFSVDEVHRLHKRNNLVEPDGTSSIPFDPLRWQLPQHPLPDSYLNFLRFSNGGFFEGTYRDLDLFSTNEVRAHMIIYGTPYRMPRSFPIAFDGAGTFYLLDMRSEIPLDDYPIVYAHAGNLSYERNPVLAQSFRALVDSRLGSE